MKLENLVKKIFRSFGLEIMKFTTSALYRRLKLIEKYKINHVLDVGANTGQYAANLFSTGFNGRISSFEPLSQAYNLLETYSKNNPNWKVYNYALGDKKASTHINVSENSVSSSLLKMLPKHEQSEPNSKVISQEEIHVEVLDAVWDDVTQPTDKIYLKLDTQGYEKYVLNGLKDNLKNIILIQMELSLVPLYAGEAGFEAMMEEMKKLNFTLVSLEDGFTDKSTGQLLQIDGIFLNKMFE